MKNTKQDSVYFFWSSSILLCMLIAVFALGFTSCQRAPNPSAAASASASPSTSADANTEAPPSDTPAAPNASVRLAETADQGQEYVDKFIFLGDSTTHGLAFYNVVDKKQVWTPESGTLTLDRWSVSTIVYPDDNSQIPIPEAAAKKKPEYMLITLGVNGVSYLDEATFTSTYTELVKAIQQASPETKIILNSIYPIVADYYGITNQKIDAANVWVENIAKATGTRYLDSASVLKDENGALPVEYSNNDGLHENATGYQRVITYLRTHAYQ
ncbi:MAG: SGNH/GDSL hydrolase family protein [Oscillospiraceae bacterium]|jgi:lysophospholipase L1-like esterase